MKDRNEFLEMDGLHWESETHEWFHDKIGESSYKEKGIALCWTAKKQIDIN
jgi:hypothetical protein